MKRKKPGRKSKSGLKKESGRWRPTRRQVLWAAGTLGALVTIALLVDQLYPGLWGDVSREPVALLKGRVAKLIGIGVALMVLIVLLVMGSASLGWTGFRGKTLWDLLQLLIVPFMLALVTVAFTWYQEGRQTRIEEQRVDSEHQIEEQRAQDVALQDYLDQMSTLLLNKDLRNSEEDSEVRTLARARTATVIQRLDADGNRNVIRFLDEAGLTKGGQSSPGLLAGVDLRGAHLEGIDLFGTDLREADLSDADLNGAQLSAANLSQANLNDVNLNGALLVGDVNLSQANLPFANLSHADLTGANLGGANLGGANLNQAFLSGANLDGALLTDADLSSANLSGAQEITKEQLDQAKSLEGATMPDGSKHP